MNLYISDTHFGHANVIRFDHRPFADSDEMDMVMISLWQGRVRPDDHVWVLVDFIYRSNYTPEWYLRQLPGHKHLIIGNHDKITVEYPGIENHFETIDKMAHIKDGSSNVVMCHFPLASWNGMKRGAIHLYGHIHNHTENDVYRYMCRQENAFNVGCMINSYTPSSLREIIENNRRFQEEVKNRELDPP